MWMFMILVWRMLLKLWRRLGRRALLAPVAVVGAALFGLNAWTAAAVLTALALAVVLALILLGRRSAGAGGLLPVTMLVTGICGLWAAATVAWSNVQGPFTSWSVLFTGPKGGGGKPPAVPRPTAVPRPSPSSGGTVNLPASLQAAQAKAQRLAAQAQAKYQAMMRGQRPTRGPGKIIYKGGGPHAVVHSLLWGRLLIVGSLVLLAIGLWLAPRALADLRAQYPDVAPKLRRWVREGNWGILLVPVTCFGLTVFGVRPWTVALIIAAVIVTIRWPRLAADLVPLVLVLFALYGFFLASRWVIVAPRANLAADPAQFTPGPGRLVGPKYAQAGLIPPGALPANPKAALGQVPFGVRSTLMAGPSATVTPTPGPSLAPTWFGLVQVDSLPTSLLAGVEASVLLAFGAWLFPRTIGTHLRGPGMSPQAAELAGRVQRLTETRNQAVDAAAAELRRIERDLHDGTQARLVALGMNLRALERMLPASSPGALALVAEARETSLRALNDLRHLVRGIYPPVLADRGLAHAIRALALDTPLPVELDIDLPGRLDAPVESACYFAVAEVLANAVKHSGAHRVHIRIQHAAGVLRMEVADDGTGGANPAAGTGLRGVERRLGTFDGIVAVNSPPGGPTMIAMEVPCELSSRKTYSS